MVWGSDSLVADEAKERRIRKEQPLYMFGWDVASLYT